MLLVGTVVALYCCEAIQTTVAFSHCRLLARATEAVKKINTRAMFFIVPPVWILPRSVLTAWRGAVHSATSWKTTYPDLNENVRYRKLFRKERISRSTS